MISCKLMKLLKMSKNPIDYSFTSEEYCVPPKKSHIVNFVCGNLKYYSTESKNFSGAGFIWDPSSMN